MGLSEHPNQENSVENRPAGRTPPPKDVAFLWEPSQAEAALGKTLDDRYTLEEVLHDSGMGLVFRASDREKLRQVVVKMIYIDDLDNDPKQLYNRFRREARGMAQISHPHIVQILGCSFSNPKRPYIVMEFIEGETLFTFLNRHKKGVLIHLFLSIMAQLCSAFDLIHKKGIIHRDLKPNNIMIQKVANGYKIKILDLGLIFFERALTQTTKLKLTRKGQVVGTPAYMSPEQCMGSEVTYLSDIYNLGLIAYELLAGRPPFMGNSPKDFFIKQLKATPKPLHVLRSDVPRKISDAIQRVLEKDPAKRHQSCREFFQALHFA